MRIVFALALALVVATASANILTDNEYEFLFTKWVGQHTKSYDTPDEFHYRFATWRSNMDYVLSHSSRKPNATHTLAMNEYGDMTNEEFRAKFTGARAPLRSNDSPVKLPTTNLPSSVNWPQKGVVTPVKNQGQCGSCWTFSTTGSVESAHAIKTGNLISLSEQELVDCSHNGGNNGCNGGLMDNAFQWIIQNGGLCTESAYPYHASDGTCKSSSCTPAVTISSYKDVTANDQDQLQAAVAQQPVSIAVDAGGMDWQFYSGGVMSDSCGTQLDHGVLAAGYGTQNGSMYWLVKNSWGANWGMQGYIMLKRTTGSGPGECGIAMSPSYPIA